MKIIINVLFFCFLMSVTLKAQDNTTIWYISGNFTNLSGGNIYTYNLDSCKAHFEYHIGGVFLDLAQTPNGRLYANTIDTLFQLYENGTKRAIGPVPMAKGLVGLNDSTLIMDSTEYIIAVSTNDASSRLIGHTGCNIDGDFTWIGKSLYTIGGRNMCHCLVKIDFNEDYSEISGMDSVSLPDMSYNMPAMATYIKNDTYKLVALPGNTQKYYVDTATGFYDLICNTSADSAYGASCMIFPTGDPTALHAPEKKSVRFDIYPNPVQDQLNISASVRDYKVIVADIFGKVVAINDAHNSRVLIDTEGLPNGIYIVKIQDKDSRILQVSKVLKQ